MKVHEIAYSRAGDKGDIANVCVFVDDTDDWPRLRDDLTVEVVTRQFGSLVEGPIVRYELPGLRGLNFVMYRALGGGISTGLRVDGFGKSYASLLLDIDL
jgi:hypothetical protein